jgi:hypothetical protein
MPIVEMTLEEAINSITEEDHARALEAARREPDLTDPDAPEISDHMILSAYRNGAVRMPVEEIIGMIAPELETSAREIYAEITARGYHPVAETTIDYLNLVCAEDNPVKYSTSYK